MIMPRHNRVDDCYTNHISPCSMAGMCNEIRCWSLKGEDMQRHYDPLHGDRCDCMTIGFFRHRVLRSHGTQK